MKTVSEKIAEFALGQSIQSIPSNVIGYGKLLLMDTFGVAMANLELEHAQAVRRVVENMESKPVCTLWGSGDKAQVSEAVLYNAALIHGSDYDDTHVAGIIHPSAAVVSTAVTVGEATGATGEEIYEAIIIGWEIIVRLGLAARGRFHDVGYHGTAIAAPFAAACVAGRLLKVSKNVLVNGLGICGSQAAGLQEFLRDGSWIKKLHPGWGTHSAVYAVNLARAGFTGPKEVFEGQFGLWKTHCGITEGLEVFDDLGKVWHTPEITFKLYPVCHMTHSFIDCLLKAREQLDPESIESIECRIEDRCYHIVCEPEEAKKNPETDYMMRFSLPYVAAVALVHGKVSPWEIDMELARDIRIRELMGKITCIADDEKRNPGYFPGWVKIRMKDKTEQVYDQRWEAGTPQNPVDMDAVMTKFHNNLEHFYTEEQIERLSELIQKMDRLESVHELIQCLRVTGSEKEER
ncbi:MAG: MmgE/PrpD family protein [Hungatella sp.]|nr:MmgE/PrpD family protein [Hungatella sp.]